MIAAVLTALAVPVLADKLPCDMVTTNEATAIVGSAVDQKAFAVTCLYKAKTGTASLVVRIAKNDKTEVTSIKANFTKANGTVKDEPSLGKGAFSAVRTNSNRVYVFKGEQMVMIDYSDAKAKIPDGLMDKLRAAARTALARL
jgi:hypothetical protein